MAPPVRHRSGGPPESAHPRNEPIAAEFDPFFDREPVRDSRRGRQTGTEDRPRSAIGHSHGMTGGKAARGDAMSAGFGTRCPGVVTDVGPGWSPRGHRSVPHTGDLCVEAWAPTREECIVEAARAMLGSFADVPPDVSWVARECTVPADDDGRLLAAVLEEIIYRMDAADELPVDIAVAPEPGGVGVIFKMADSSTATQTGAVPKAVALHGLRLAPDAHGWSCRVTLDV